MSCSSCSSSRVQAELFCSLEKKIEKRIRSLQKDKLEVENSIANNNDSLESEHKLRKKKHKKNSEENEMDPSLKFIANPLDIPTVLDARHFFGEYCKDFKVYIGRTNGWRTVC